MCASRTTNIGYSCNTILCPRGCSHMSMVSMHGLKPSMLHDLLGTQVYAYFHDLGTPFVLYIAQTSCKTFSGLRTKMCLGEASISLSSVGVSPGQGGNIPPYRDSSAGCTAKSLQHIPGRCAKQHSDRLHMASLNGCREGNLSKQVGLFLSQ